MKEKASKIFLYVVWNSDDSFVYNVHKVLYKKKSNVEYKSTFIIIRLAAILWLQWEYSFVPILIEKRVRFGVEKLKLMYFVEFYLYWNKYQHLFSVKKLLLFYISWEVFSRHLMKCGRRLGRWSSVVRESAEPLGVVFSCSKSWSCSKLKCLCLHRFPWWNKLE